MQQPPANNYGGQNTVLNTVPGYNPEGGKPAGNDPSIAMGTPMQPNGAPMAGAPAQGGNDIDDLQARMDALKNL
jgi:hypothetical protein